MKYSKYFIASIFNCVKINKYKNEYVLHFINMSKFDIIKYRHFMKRSELYESNFTSRC